MNTPGKTQVLPNYFSRYKNYRGVFILHHDLFMLKYLKRYFFLFFVDCYNRFSEYIACFLQFKMHRTMCFPCDIFSVFGDDKIELNRGLPSDLARRLSISKKLEKHWYKCLLVFVAFICVTSFLFDQKKTKLFRKLHLLFCKRVVPSCIFGHQHFKSKKLKILGRQLVRKWTTDAEVKFVENACFHGCIL